MPKADSPFWELENVVVTPCRVTSLEMEEASMTLFFGNLRDFKQESRWRAWSTKQRATEAVQYTSRVNRGSLKSSTELDSCSARAGSTTRIVDP